MVDNKHQPKNYEKNKKRVDGINIYLLTLILTFLVTFL